ncbi:MAG: N-acetylmuramoyl-L-alanine amidase [Chlorobi bacterium]|nr:N-acetylmuramoyl-L-alanine amidase [Chlorobiota bacterium]
MQKNILIYISLSLLLLITSINGQRLLKVSVSKNGKKGQVSSIVRNGMTYISAKDISKILSGNYYYNPTAAKVEMKFDNFNLKVTAKNQFVVLTDKNENKSVVFQIPISTLLINNDVFLPIDYTLKYIEIAYQKKLKYNKKTKDLLVTNDPSDIFEQLRYTTPTEITVAKSPAVKRISNYDIFSMDITEMANGTLIRLKTTRRINKYSSSIHEGKLFFFVSGASIDPAFIKSAKPAGAIRKVRVKTVRGNKQIEFTLKGGVKYADSLQSSSKDIDTDDILITIQNGALDKLTKNLENDKNKWNFDVIVIDAGHGGKDPGAIGVTGLKEKDVNLSIALELGKILKEKMPDVNVVQTRTKDKFVELYKRGKIANENSGKLFISIHANSLGRKNSKTRGFEVYLLRPGKTEKAIKIAEMENSVIKYEDNPQRYQALTDENFILVTMAHSAYLRYSERFAEILYKNWEKELKVPARGVKQAGFLVLVGASMPSVLVETGFISNRKDEAYLKSKKGRKQIAGTIYESIVKYREFYKKQMSEESN